MEKPTAQSFSAGGKRENAPGPLQWSDKCFLCGMSIGETDPRGFYMGKAAMVLCHRGCLNIMDTNGGKPADFHRAMEKKNTKPVMAASEELGFTGPSWLDFPDLTALQAHTKAKGEIASHIKVTIAGSVIQAGE